MAAILCNGICDICFKLPCEACDAVCSGCNRCNLCDVVFCSPLSAYVIVTVLVQAPSIFYAIDGMLQPLAGDFCIDEGDEDEYFDKNLIWLIGSTITSVIHIVAAIYLLIRVRNANDEQLRSFRGGYDRASYLLCQDTWMAFYILIFIFFFIWILVGSSWIYYYYIPSCIDEEILMTVLSLDWCFFFLGPIALTFSLCCTACCDNEDYTNRSNGIIINSTRRITPEARGTVLARTTVLPTRNPTTTTGNTSTSNNTNMNDSIKDTTKAINDKLQDGWDKLSNKIQAMQEKK
mmetsp:Transcript_27273/g.31127  ORF Transcript_27273/g.31127 Transcript_27273/m.31127 type:complete len:291 (+) Transcript_27273:47-919(+)